MKTPAGRYGEHPVAIAISNAPVEEPMEGPTGEEEPEVPPEEPTEEPVEEEPETPAEEPLQADVLKATVKLKTADGKEGTQTFDLPLPTQMTATGKETTLVTCYVTLPNGYIGKSTFDLPITPNGTVMPAEGTEPTGNNVKVTVRIEVEAE